MPSPSTTPKPLTARQSSWGDSRDNVLAVKVPRVAPLGDGAVADLAELLRNNVLSEEIPQCLSLERMRGSVRQETDEARRGLEV